MDAEFGLKKIKEYVERNVVRAREGRKCVDGRYLPTQASGMIARPGGDLGYVMALLAVNKQKNLGLTPEQCFDGVYDVVIRKNSHFYMHTDHHASGRHDTKKALIGCGHVAKAAMEDLSKEYDLDGKDVERIVAYARSIAKVSSRIEIVNLNGEHEEKGVLVVKSGKYTVNAKDPYSHEMFFIYDAARDTEFIENLVEEMDIQDISFGEMKRELDMQLRATLHNLAKGLPIYNVTFRGRFPSIFFDSFVL